MTKLISRRFQMVLLLGIACVPSAWSDEAAAPRDPIAKVTVDTRATPDLADWGAKAGELCTEWYGKIHALLPSEGHVPRTSVKLVFDPQMKGVAHASGDTITIAAPYVRRHRDDFGMVVHELTHVVQGYPTGGSGLARRGNRGLHSDRALRAQAPRPKIDPDKASYKRRLQDHGDVP